MMHPKRAIGRAVDLMIDSGNRFDKETCAITANPCNVKNAIFSSVSRRQRHMTKSSCMIPLVRKAINPRRLVVDIDSLW